MPNRVLYQVNVLKLMVFRVQKQPMDAIVLYDFPKNDFPIYIFFSKKLTSTAYMCDCPTSKYFDDNTKGCGMICN